VSVCKECGDKRFVLRYRLGPDEVHYDHPPRPTLVQCSKCTIVNKPLMVVTSTKQYVN